ncbi:MAG: hypothetical protein JSU09_10050 [Bacteroidetes bacterium]|nr:hypothetical protein [Bacteroidota bacterium]
MMPSNTLSIASLLVNGKVKVPEMIDLFLHDNKSIAHTINEIWTKRQKIGI